jgi:hypothetical protein
MSQLLNQPSPAPSKKRLAAIRRALMLGVCAAGALLTYGLLRFPAVLTVSPMCVRSLIGVIRILILYAAAGWFGPAFAERLHPQILRVDILSRGQLCGLRLQRPERLQCVCDGRFQGSGFLLSVAVAGHGRDLWSAWCDGRRSLDTFAKGMRSTPGLASTSARTAGVGEPLFQYRAMSDFFCLMS